MKLLKFISEDFSCFFKELSGIYNVIQYIHWHYPVYHTASLTHVAKYAFCIASTTETVHCFVKL